MGSERIPFPGKMPFEDSLMEWLKSHPGCSLTDASRDMGVGLHAIYAAAVSLEEKGLIASEEEEASQ